MTHAAFEPKPNVDSPSNIEERPVTRRTQASRLAGRRNAPVLLALSMALACGSESSGGAGPGSAGTSGMGGAGGALSSVCTTPAPKWPDPVELSPLAWGQDPSLTDEAICALRALDAEVEKSRLLCSSENDHGVAESSRWHALIARYAVLQQGVRVIALEAPGAMVSHWDRYLQTGDPFDLSKGFQDTQGSLGNIVEQERFIDELRAVNAELPAGESLRLVGFDIAVQPFLTRAALLEFVGIVEPNELSSWTTSLTTSDWPAGASAAAALHTQVEDKKGAYVSATDAETWKLARRNAANLRDGFRFIELYTQGNFWVGNATYREPGMIRNVEELLADLPEGQRLLLIAHNRHCGRSESAGTTASGQDSPALGTHLATSAKWGGERYLVIGQMYERGARRVPQTLVTESFQAAPGTHEAFIGSITSANGLLVGGGAGFGDLDKQKPMFQWPGGTVPEQQFDAMIWLREVQATQIR